ncbi:membrane protein insertase YidC [Gaoshiqia sediminis]|uniref:Membrane protein insertase YidC n=1 Tax=Gaoshiqia sediminis TaxID=2986998 RepID=A0AA41Y847_9BACT|nr:membrane protein insertase YidC [Gaoshiqia sediminis]MCW0482902.1 membrane protein insertase YidC [Gaoshiqia sediminis]
MDKNTIVGMVLIFAILIGFSYLNKPSQEEIEAARRRQDSIAQVEAERRQEAEVRITEMATPEVETLASDSSQLTTAAQDRFGIFAPAATGEEKFITLENNLMKVKVSTKGGKIYSVELKNYQTYDSLPLILFDGPENLFGLNFFAQNRSIRTDDLFFVPSVNQELLTVGGPEVRKGKEGNEEFNEEHGGDSQVLAMQLPAGDGGYLEYQYTLSHNSYMVGFHVKAVGMNNLISSNTNYLNFNWAVAGPRLERKSQYGEDRYTSVNYKYFGDEVDKLSPAKSSEETLKTKVKWISFKQLFFNSTIIADEAFPTADVKFNYTEDSKRYVGDFYADIAFPYEGDPNQAYGMKFYFGPNHYNTLKQYDIELDQLVNLGYSVLRWVNRFLVIPVFNFLRNYIGNFGIIILLLTVFIKLILFPFTYKSYISQAKMRALKPEIDELNEKFGKDKPMEKQQATMALYKKAGVNPMGGCLPMLLQMPILFAMFFFFPTSIELRQESFLWANDLSSYDSILNLPFTIPFYGDHVSLFCLLMTVTTIISTKLNSQATSSQAMPGMQTMMYMMPVMFLFILNSYPSGLSYYYFLANLITIGQMYLFRVLIDEEKIRAQLHANKKKGPVVKSKFQQRLERMAKERGVQLPK